MAERAKRRSGLINDLTVGESAQMQRKLCEEDVRQFAALLGDFNPVHLDEEYASQTRFGGRIAHGLFCSAMISALLGMQLPGIGTIILSETLNFRYPAYIGDTVTARVTVASVDCSKRRAELTFICINQHGRTLLDGSVTVTE